MTLLDWLYQNRIVATQAEARRLALNGAIQINNEIVIDLLFHVTPQDTIKVGKTVYQLTPDQLLKQGGTWLGAARSYLQWNVIRGDSLTWGSNEPVTLTVRQIEELAAHVACAVLKSNKERL